MSQTDYVPSQYDKVTVKNFPASYPVSGSVSVSNFPATQPVSGTVEISGFIDQISRVVDQIAASGGGSGVIPSGTGWRHVTSGVEDAAASTPTKADVGLGNAENTSDASKPISTATQTALDGKAASSHAHSEADITNLTTDLSAKVDKSGSLTQITTRNHSDLTGAGTNAHSVIDTFISSKAAASGLASLDSSSKLVQSATIGNGGLVHANLSNGTLALAFGTNTSVKVTPTATGSFTTTVPAAGVSCTLIILTSGTNSYTMTFGTGFKSTGTMATGTVTAKTFVVSFISDGTSVIETSRTVAI